MPPKTRSEDFEANVRRLRAMRRMEDESMLEKLLNFNRDRSDFDDMIGLRIREDRARDVPGVRARGPGAARGEHARDRDRDQGAGKGQPREGDARAHHGDRRSQDRGREARREDRPPREHQGAAQQDGMKQSGPRARKRKVTKHTTFRLSEEARGLLHKYADKRGISLTAALEQMIRGAT